MLEAVASLTEALKYLEDNTEVANAIGTATSAAIAVFAFIVSLISLYVALATLRKQTRHNVLTVRPIPEVTVADYEDSLRVKLRNHGSGALIVKDIHVGDGKTVRKTLLEWMPSLPPGMYWSNYSGEIRGRSILPGGEIVLVLLEGDDSNNEFAQVRDACRSILRHLTVIVEYTDVYETDMTPLKKRLDWFGRHVV